MAGVTSVVISGTTFLVDDINAVDFSEAQGLTKTQQQQGRENIDAANAGAVDALKDVVKAEILSEYDKALPIVPTYSYGSAIVPETGRNMASTTAARTAYIAYDSDVVVALDNPDYLLLIWCYTTANVNAGVFSPTNMQYVPDGYVLVRHIQGAQFFKIGFMRADGAVLNTNVEDVNSDAYIVKNGLKIYQRGVTTADVDALEQSMTAAQGDISALQADTEQYGVNALLLHGEIPNTTQTIAFNQATGDVSTITHKRGNTVIRTDAFTFAEGSITEVRTLNTGESLTIVTNTDTLVTTVTYAAT